MDWGTVLELLGTSRWDKILLPWRNSRQRDVCVWGVRGHHMAAADVIGGGPRLLEPTVT